MDEGANEREGLRQLRWDGLRWGAEAVALVGGVVVVASNVPPTPSGPGPAWLAIGAALSFLALMATAVEIILSRRRGSSPEPSTVSAVRTCTAEQTGLPAHEILELEFEYARVTASEAMNDRHTIVNFYLLLTGVVLSAVVGLFGAAKPTGIVEGHLPYAGTVLLWALCIVGWLYLLQIVRLRQAWLDSAMTMNQIKDFYAANVAQFDAQEFGKAFRWRTDTLPRPQALWTIHFFSAALIALLNSLVYVGGALLLAVGLELAEGWPLLIVSLAILGSLLFAYSLHMYVVFLERSA